MFKEMGKSGLPGYFPAGANMVHNGIGDYRIGMISVKYYLKSVRHNILLITYFQFVCQGSSGTSCADRYKGQNRKNLNKVVYFIHCQ